MEGSCPLTKRQIIDEYFIENRTRLLDIAAFLDRLERSIDQSPARDFRMEAFHRALLALSSESTGRIEQLQLIFSDPTTELKEKLDTKSASGAWNPVVIV